MTFAMLFDYKMEAYWPVVMILNGHLLNSGWVVAEGLLRILKIWRQRECKGWGMGRRDYGKF
jgi:hypothetical protein